MFGRFTSCLLTLGAGLLFACGFAVIVGCSSSPRERYRVLSVFFDGVPNPDAPRRAATPNTPASDEGRVVTAVVVSRHKPYNDGKCAACHNSATGDIEEFDKAYQKCTTCHKDVMTSRPHTHGPVANNACRWCHTAHESNQPALLKDPPIQVCTQCHDQQLLGNNPPQHIDGKTSCIDCHFGHGGPDPYYLKPAATRPAATAPATAPATQPATQPGTPHASTQGGPV